jgi:site-specific recombinase XerD
VNSLHFSLLETRQDHIRRYLHYLSKELGRAVSTVNRHLMSLRKFYGFVAKQNLLTNDPTAGVALTPDSGSVSTKTLTDSETEKLLFAARNRSRAGLVRRDVAILQLLLHTGLRVGEVVELQTDDLIFDHPGIHLRVRSSQQHGPARELPLSGELCKVLDKYLQVRPHSSSGHLFLSQGGRPISTRTVQRIIAQCAKEAKVDDVSAQALRRTYATQLYIKTKDLVLVSRRLGHQNITYTEQYLSGHQ